MCTFVRNARGVTTQFPYRPLICPPQPSDARPKRGSWHFSTSHGPRPDQSQSKFDIILRPLILAMRFRVLYRVNILLIQASLLRPKRTEHNAARILSRIFPDFCEQVTETEEICLPVGACKQRFKSTRSNQFLAWKDRNTVLFGTNILKDRTYLVFDTQDIYSRYHCCLRIPT